MNKQFSMKRNVRLKEQVGFGKIAKRMFWEPEEYPTIEDVNCDFTERVNTWIDRNDRLIKVKQDVLSKKDRPQSLTIRNL